MPSVERSNKWMKNLEPLVLMVQILVVSSVARGRVIFDIISHRLPEIAVTNQGQIGLLVVMAGRV